MCAGKRNIFNTRKHKRKHKRCYKCFLLCIKKGACQGDLLNIVGVLTPKMSSMFPL